MTPTGISASNPANRLAAQIESRDALIGVIGLGYVGLPLGLTFAEKGFHVLGFDVDPAKIDMLEAGHSYLRHHDGGRIARANDSGRFSATCDMDRLSEPDVLVICVPTPLGEGRTPDLRFVRSTGKAIASRLRQGQLVILESTTYPGTTTEVLQPLLEAGGMTCGTDFYLAYSPEREDPGNPDFSTAGIPKVVAGADTTSGALASALYGAVVPQVVNVSSTAAAEATKLLENVFRAVNIALVNELKLVYDRMGVDIWEVLDAAESKPFGFMRFNPGPGWGGHCIPIDPFYLSWKARELGLETRFIELAGEINVAMPEHVVGRLEGALRDRGAKLAGARVLLLGMAYKKNVDDLRESPALEILELLEDKGARVTFHDPYIAQIPPTRRHPERAGLESADLTPEALVAADAVVLVTDHDDVDYDAVLEHASLIVDTRGVYREPSKHVIRA